MKKFSLATLALVFSISAMPFASAHTELVKSYPAAGDVVSSMPQTVSLEFSENLMLMGDKTVNTVSLTGPTGTEVVIGSMSVIQNTITADIADGEFLNGDYTMTFKVVSADGHKVSDSVTFTLDDPNAVKPEPSLLVAPAPTNSHGVATGIVVALGTLLAILALAIAYRRFSAK